MAHEVCIFFNFYLSYEFFVSMRKMKEYIFYTQMLVTLVTYVHTVSYTLIQVKTLTLFLFLLCNNVFT